MEKDRTFLFDTFRGLLIWSIPISHFTRVGGDFSQGSLSGIVYITINVFVMQAFMFLSGYFSKKPDRARETAFRTFLMPYLIFTVVFYLFRYAYFGNAHLTFLTPPFALWFLFSVFFYRFFLKDIIKVPHILVVCFAVYLIAGQIPFFNDFLALGRTVSYFPFFMLGYFCTKEHLAKVQAIKKWKVAVLGIVLTGISCALAFFVDVPVGFYLLKTSAAEIGIAWWTDILMRVLMVFLGCGWIIFMMNILPKSDNYLTYVGKNTMPIYIFHLFVRYIVEDYGFPETNAVVYYLCIFGLASLCVVVFASPPVAKLYDGMLESCYKGWLFITRPIRKLLNRKKEG